MVPYWHFEHNPPPPSLTEARDYDGSSDVSITCTQLGEEYSASARKRVIAEWCALLAQKLPMRRCWFHSRVPQEIFDAVTNQSDLQALYIKWSAIKDLSRITELRNLTHLSIGSSAGVVDVAPIAGLPKLLDLTLENFQKVADYTPLAKLKTLKHLELTGDCFAPRKIRIASLDFLGTMRQLQSLRLEVAKIADGSYAPLKNLRALEHLDIPHPRDPAQTTELVAALPQLKSGNVLAQSAKPDSV